MTPEMALELSHLFEVESRDKERAEAIRLREMSDLWNEIKIELIRKQYQGDFQ
jgi:hypothetical protein